jgi:dienelactone hydrolase
MKLFFIFLSIFLSISAVHAAGESITYRVNGKSYEGYYVSPAADAPLVLLIHDWNGLTDYEKKRAEMLAKEGYAVIAAGLFGAGIRPAEDKDKRQHTGELYRDRAKMRALMHGALDAVKTKGINTNNVVVMGYCFGGAAALEMARSGADMKGFVSFHGGLATPEGQGYENTRGKVMVFHGTADTAISMEDFAQLARELETAGVPHEMISYGGAPHGFTEFDSDRYRADADSASWNRFLEFLEETL